MTMTQTSTTSTIIIESVWGQYLTMDGDWGVRQYAREYTLGELPTELPWDDGAAVLIDGTWYDEDNRGVAAPVPA